MRRTMTALGFAALFFSAQGTAQATLIPVGSRSALGGNLHVDWSLFGPSGTLISTPDFRLVPGGPPAVTVGVASSQGTLARVDEGAGYIGDFAPGAHLLADAGSESDSFIVSFQPVGVVRGFGVQVEAHYITGPFTGEVEAFSASNVLLGTLPFAGTKDSREDDSAPFVGAVATPGTDISYLVFLINQPDPSLPPRSGALAINTLDLLTVVPEPASLALLLSGVLAVAGLRRRGR